MNKILHVLPDSVYASYFCELIKNYPNNDFITTGKNQYISLPSVYTKNSTLHRIHKTITATRKYDHIFLHFLDQIGSIAALFKSKDSKFHWIVWGGDLYANKRIQHNFKSKLLHLLKTLGNKRIDYLHAALRGDYLLAKQLFNKNYIYERFIYPTLDVELFDSLVVSHRSRCMQIGNSADPSNNHEEILRKIRTILSRNIKILCPLSYGDKKYAENIIKLGRSLFGSNFVPITHFMSYNEYIKHLNSIDCLIFNHKRQQGLGNLNIALYLGKKVYVRSDTSTYKDYSSMNFKLFDTLSIGNDLSVDNLLEQDPAISEHNKTLVVKEFSNEKALELWDAIYQECMR